MSNYTAVGRLNGVEVSVSITDLSEFVNAPSTDDIYVYFVNDDDGSSELITCTKGDVTWIAFEPG